jgi:phage regulator Rha-like protein
MPGTEIEKLIQKAIQICQLVGIQSESHFKKIYVYDNDTNRMSIDWRISKKGFNLLVMQCNKINQRNALWLWN